MQKIELILDAWYEDNALIVESKGWHPAEIKIDGVIYHVEFYDPVRLSQEIEDSISKYGYFAEKPKMIVVENVTRNAMEKAISKISANIFNT